LLQAITAAARQDMQDGRVHRLSYMAQVVKIVVQLEDLAKKVSAFPSLASQALFPFNHALMLLVLEGRSSARGY